MYYDVFFIPQQCIKEQCFMFQYKKKHCNFVPKLLKKD